jgi:hypothetical protein
MRISPFGAAMTISNVASISIMGLSRTRRHRDFLFEADRMTDKISAGGDRLRVPRGKENPATPAFVVAGFPAPLYERENRGAAYANGCDGLVFLRRKENPATGEHGGVPGPCALGERDTLLWGQRGKRFRRSRVPGTVSIRSHYGPNSDTGLCEVKARGEFSVFPTPCYSAPLGPRLGGAFS